MKNSLIPELRFSEFEGDWERKLLSDLFSFKNGVNASKKDYGSGYKFINVLDIIENDFITHDKIIGEVNIPEDVFQKNIVEYGDVLFQRSSETREEVGQANVYLDRETPATFGGFVIRGKAKVEYEPSFMNALLKTARSRKEITTKSGGSTRYNVGQETLSEVNIFIPKLEEQTKIANFLTAVDKRIDLLREKKEKLELYKKGVMQKIFSQQIRFKDDNGNDFPDWEEKRLGEVCDIVVGGTPSTTNKDYWNGNIGWIGSGELKNNHIKTPTKYITKVGLKKSSAQLMPKNTVVLAMTGATLGKIGILDISCSGNQSVAGFIPSSRYVSLYLFYILQNETKQILSFAGGAAQVGINKNNIESLRILFPTILEQQKIANFLSAIDKMIDRVNLQMAQTKEWKKGLLQKMFV